MNRLPPRRKLTPTEQAEVLDRQDHCCDECGKRFQHLTDTVEYDHSRELWEGGSNDIDNFRALHAHCHKGKTAAATTRRAKADRVGWKHRTGPAAEAERARRAGKKRKLKSRNTLVNSALSRRLKGGVRPKGAGKMA